MDIVMPQMGESVSEGTVTAWLKAPGDAVAKDEPLLEIQTDKVDTVIDSPVSGVLAEIIVEPGETVSVGARLGRLAVDGDAEALPERAELPDPSPKAHFGSGDRANVVAFSRGEIASGGESVHAPARRYSPAVLAAASERGLSAGDLAAITPTGRGDRLTLADVTRASEVASAGSVPSTNSALTQSRATDAPADYFYVPTARDIVVAMSPMRRRIAEHMSWSRRISAHATTFDDVEVGALSEWLAEAKQESRASGRPSVTWTAAIAHAVTVCLGDFPYLNAAIVGDEIAVRPYVHLGIAVAVGRDLIVPIITDAHLTDLHGLSARLADLTARARSRQLDNSEVRGGTFTYSNPGIAGGLFGTPILNQPQVALLSTNAVRDRPWVVGAEVVPRPVMGVSLSFDHRIVDGMMGFEFIEALRGLLAEPYRLATARYTSALPIDERSPR